MIYVTYNIESLIYKTAYQKHVLNRYSLRSIISNYFLVEYVVFPVKYIYEAVYIIFMCRGPCPQHRPSLAKGHWAGDARRMPNSVFH